LIAEGNKVPALLYSVFVSNDPERLAQECVRDLGRFASDIVDGFPDVPMRLRCLTIIEAMEQEYLRLTDVSYEEARDFCPPKYFR
jgi:hypothetical protein